MGNWNKSNKLIIWLLGWVRVKFSHQHSDMFWNSLWGLEAVHSIAMHTIVTQILVSKYHCPQDRDRDLWRNNSRSVADKVLGEPGTS